MNVDISIITVREYPSAYLAIRLMIEWSHICSTDLKFPTSHIMWYCSYRIFYVLYYRNTATNTVYALHSTYIWCNLLLGSCFDLAWPSSCHIRLWRPLLIQTTIIKIYLSYLHTFDNNTILSDVLYGIDGRSYILREEWYRVPRTSGLKRE